MVFHARTRPSKLMRCGLGPPRSIRRCTIVWNRSSPAWIRAPMMTRSCGRRLFMNSICSLTCLNSTKSLEKEASVCCDQRLIKRMSRRALSLASSCSTPFFTNAKVSIYETIRNVLPGYDGCQPRCLATFRAATNESFERATQAVHAT